MFKIVCTPLVEFRTVYYPLYPRSFIPNLFLFFNLPRIWASPFSYPNFWDVSCFLPCSFTSTSRTDSAWSLFAFIIDLSPRLVYHNFCGNIHLFRLSTSHAFILLKLRVHPHPDVYKHGLTWLDFSTIGGVLRSVRSPVQSFHIFPLSWMKYINSLSSCCCY